MSRSVSLTSAFSGPGRGLSPYCAFACEHPAAQEPVDLGLARRVRARQPLERVWLVGGVVIDVEIGIAIESLDQEVHNLLESTLLFVRIVAPKCVVAWAPLHHLENAEEV